MAIICYIFAFLSLVAGLPYLVFDIRKIIRLAKNRIFKNKYASRAAQDYSFRTLIFTVPGMLSNILFAIINGVTGLVVGSAWLWFSGNRLLE